jgi:two-component system, sensor histidine kinase and response regulator
LHIYHHQIQRINNIVMSLIDIARMKHIEVQKQKIDFDQLVNECICSYQYAVNFSIINFIKEVAVGLNFNSARASVNSILYNLIEKAIKYSRKDERAFVRVAILTANRAMHNCRG